MALELVEVMDGGRVLFAAARGGTCVWRMEEPSAIMVLWAGVCDALGDMNGTGA